MKNNNEKRAGALVPLASSVPAFQAQIDDDTWKRLDRELQESLMRKRKDLAPHASRYGMAACAGAVVAASPLLVALGPASLVVLMPILGMSAMAANDQKKYANLLADSHDGQMKKLHRTFREAQEEAYNAQKKQLLAAAEQHIAQGNLVSLEDAAWLANLSGRDIGNATHQLAITAFQIRKLLAHSRCADFNQDGSRKIGRPDTFAAHNLQAGHESHRQFLRLALREADKRIAEDTPPAFAEPELVEEPQLKRKLGLLGGFRVLIDPLSGGRIKRELENAKTLRIKPMIIPALQPATDFAQALENYERGNPPLDLPAVRGWGGGRRKALPGPKNF